MQHVRQVTTALAMGLRSRVRPANTQRQVQGAVQPAPQALPRLPEQRVATPAPQEHSLLQGRAAVPHVCKATIQELALWHVLHVHRIHTL